MICTVSSLFSYSPLHLQPECLDDLCYVIMKEFGRMIYRVDQDDVARARNQVWKLFPVGGACIVIFCFTSGMIFICLRLCTTYLLEMIGDHLILNLLPSNFWAMKTQANIHMAAYFLVAVEIVFASSPRWNKSCC